MTVIDDDQPLRIEPRETCEIGQPLGRDAGWRRARPGTTRERGVASRWA